MAVTFDVAKAASSLEKDFITACSQSIALRGLLTEILFKWEGQGLSWTGNMIEIPKNDDVTNMITAFQKIKEVLDTYKTALAKGENLK